MLNNKLSFFLKWNQKKKILELCIFLLKMEIQIWYNLVLCSWSTNTPLSYDHINKKKKKNIPPLFSKHSKIGWGGICAPRELNGIAPKIWLRIYVVKSLVGHNFVNLEKFTIISGFVFSFGFSMVNVCYILCVNI